jgi:uncharacterized spore protein YtfJ
MELNRLFDTVDRVQEKATVEAVFGPPTKVDGKTIFPIGRVVYGFGLGFGQGTMPATPSSAATESDESDVAGGSGAGGGGLLVQPLAVLEVTPEATTINPVVDDEKIAKMTLYVIAWSVFCLARALVKIFGKK